MTKQTEYRQHNNYDRRAASDESGVQCNGPSMTDQSFAEDADINVIMERYGMMGTMPINPKIPMYGDFTDVGDYHKSMAAILKAQQDFMQLTPKVRARFNNDPQQLLEFMDNEQNMEEAVKLGLAKEPAKITTPTEPPKPAT